MSSFETGARTYFALQQPEPGDGTRTAYTRMSSPGDDSSATEIMVGLVALVDLRRAPFGRRTPPTRRRGDTFDVNAGARGTQRDGVKIFPMTAPRSALWTLCSPTNTTGGPSPAAVIAGRFRGSRVMAKR